MYSLLQNRSSKIWGLAICLILLVVSLYLSVTLGIVKTNWRTVAQAFIDFNGSNEHIIIRNVRIPRTFTGAAIGISLGISGVMLQALTRNPLADASIFGINSGAAFSIVLAVTFFSVSSLHEFIWIGFIGAAISGFVVYMLGSVGRNGLTPLKIALAGAAISALASSFTHGILVINERALEEVLFWLTGSVEGRKIEMLLTVLPFMLFAWISAFIVAAPINTLLLGEDVAKGLGQRTLLVKIFVGILIILLAGSSVALAGPIGFIGLVIPHIARFLAGSDTRWVVLYSAFLGAILLLAADIGARFVAMPKEIPLGVMTALIGTPFFIYVARKGHLKHE